MSGDIVVLEEFSVVAVRGKGVWIVDEDDNAWHVGGEFEAQTEDNKLVRAYRSAFDE
jgi:hypothetical protein